MILLVLSLLLAAVALWNLLVGVIWMAWICGAIVLLSLFHFVEWLVKD